MGDAGRRHEGQHAVEEADAGAQDRREDQLLAGDLRRRPSSVSGVSISIRLERQVAGDLVAEQHADLVEELAEALRRALLVPHQGQLVLHQRMIDDGDALHALVPRFVIVVTSCSSQNTVPSLITESGGEPSPRRLPRQPPARRPGAAFEHLGEGKVAPRRALASRGSGRAIRSSSATVSARHSTTSGESTACGAPPRPGPSGRARRYRGRARRCGIPAGR